MKRQEDNQRMGERKPVIRLKRLQKPGERKTVSAIKLEGRWSLGERRERYKAPRLQELAGIQEG